MDLEFGPMDEVMKRDPALVLELICLQLQVKRSIRAKKGWYKGDNQRAKNSVEEGREYRKQEGLE